MHLLKLFLLLPYPISIIAYSIVITVLFFLFIIPITGRIFNKLEEWEIRGFNRFINPKITLFIANRLTLPGVIVHEYSHAIFAKLTGAIVNKISVFDIFHKGMLGHVDFSLTGGKIKQSLQLTLTSCAPIIMGFMVLIVLSFGVLPTCKNLGEILLIIYLIISIVNHLSMSPQDIMLYRRGLMVTVVVVSLMLMLVLAVTLQKPVYI